MVKTGGVPVPGTDKWWALRRGGDRLIDTRRVRRGPNRIKVLANDHNGVPRPVEVNDNCRLKNKEANLRFLLLREQEQMDELEWDDYENGGCGDSENHHGNNEEFDPDAMRSRPRTKTRTPNAMRS